MKDDDGLLENDGADGDEVNYFGDDKVHEDDGDVEDILKVDKEGFQDEDGRHIRDNEQGSLLRTINKAVLVHKSLEIWNVMVLCIEVNNEAILGVNFCKVENDIENTMKDNKNNEDEVLVVIKSYSRRILD